MHIAVRPSRIMTVGLAFAVWLTVIFIAHWLQELLGRQDDWMWIMLVLAIGLLGAGFCGFMLANMAQVTCDADSRARLLRVERRWRGGATGRTFPYDDIRTIRVESGRVRRGPMEYAMFIVAKDGRPFATGASFDYAENANALAERLAAEINASPGGGGRVDAVATSPAEPPRDRERQFRNGARFFGGGLCVTAIAIAIEGIKGQLHTIPAIAPLFLVSYVAYSAFTYLAYSAPVFLRRHLYGDVDGPVQLQWDSDRRMVEVRRRRVYGMETWHFTGKEIFEIVVEREDSPEQSASCVVRIVTHEIRTGPDLRETLLNPVERREETVLRSADPDEARATARRLAIEIGCPIRDAT